ncbi:MAG: transcription antitermination factor NusB [Pseudomonadota bacterium]
MSAQSRKADNHEGTLASGRERTGLVARKLAASILEKVLDEQRPLDAMLDAEHGIASYRALIAKDRNLIRAILGTALRRKGEIEFALSKMLDRPLPKRARHLQHTLSIAAAQILFLDVPDRAAVDLGVTAIAEDGRTARFRGLTNAILRRLSREKEALLALETPPAANLPSWVFKQLRKDFGKARTQSIASALTALPPLDITVKTDASKWVERLGGVALSNGTVRLKQKGDVTKLAGFAEGEWWVQDAAASLPASLLGDISGTRVADLCAAPGGKTAQLVMMGANVTALEKSASRLKRLQQNLSRLELDANLIQADLLEIQADEPFDAVLLDAPCSSTGTARRHPDVFWTKTPEDVASVAKLQREMIDKAATLLKPGGTLILSNCSMFKQEGEDLVAGIGKAHDLIELAPFEKGEFPFIDPYITGQGTARTLPDGLPNEDPELSGMDGFFVARFHRRS